MWSSPRNDTRRAYLAGVAIVAAIGATALLIWAVLELALLLSPGVSR
jgi:hypothetical protein